MLGGRCCFLLGPRPAPADPTHTRLAARRCHPVGTRAGAAWTASAAQSEACGPWGSLTPAPLTSVSCGVVDRLCKGSALLGGPLQPPRGDEPRGPSVRAHERGHVEGPGGGLCVSPPLPRGPVSQPCQSLETRLAAAPLSASSGAGALSGAAWGLSPLRDMMAAAASWCRGRSRSDVREGAVGTGTKPPQPRRDLPRFVVLAPPLRHVAVLGLSPGAERSRARPSLCSPVGGTSRDQRLLSSHRLVTLLPSRVTFNEEDPPEGFGKGGGSLGRGHMAPGSRRCCGSCHRAVSSDGSPSLGPPGRTASHSSRAVT